MTRNKYDKAGQGSGLLTKGEARISNVRLLFSKEPQTDTGAPKEPLF